MQEGRQTLLEICITTPRGGGWRKGAGAHTSIQRTTPYQTPSSSRSFLATTDSSNHPPSSPYLLSHASNDDRSMFIHTLKSLPTPRVPCHPGHTKRSVPSHHPLPFAIVFRDSFLQFPPSFSLAHYPYYCWVKAASFLQFFFNLLFNLHFVQFWMSLLTFIC